MTSRIHYTKPSITELEIRYATDAATNGWGERMPDAVLILPWNIAEEVINQHAYIREWGGRFVTAVPELRDIP